MAKLVLRIYIIHLYLAILYIIIYTKCLINQQPTLSKNIYILMCSNWLILLNLKKEFF